MPAGEKPEIPESLNKAFLIFVDEMDKHVSALRDALTGLQELPEYKEKQQLAHRFHTIKGGAGFLSLSDIAEIASRGEKLLRDQLSSSDPLRDLRTIVIELSHRAEALRD